MRSCYAKLGPTGRPVKRGDFPEDVLLEILLRLPVKILLQFKCVSKHWYALIESPSFVNRHFLHDSNQESLLVRHYSPHKNQYANALYLDDTFTEYIEPDHLQMPVPVAALMGPLNGIFCVVSFSGRMALLNPATRQFKPLPLANPNVEPHLSSDDDLLGFGLDTLTGNYKLVFIQYFWNEETEAPDYPSLVSVYNSGSNSWRHFEEVDLVNSSRCAYRSLCNTYLNGVYYWVTEFNVTEVAILAFDMTLETFHEIQVPDCIKSREGELALYRDSLALLSCELDKVDKCVDVWVLTKEGSWTKSLRVGPFQDLQYTLGFYKNNELLLETGFSLLSLYNVHTETLRLIPSRKRDKGYFVYWVFSYKESLVSLNVKGEKCERWDASSDFVKDFLK